MASLLGVSLGRYHILEQLGEGGMATVYKAYDTRLERDVAVKIIRRESFPPDQLERILKRFEREAKALAKLSHPNIVGVIDYGDHEGSPYLVMEFLPSGTLKQRLGKPIPWRETVRLLLPIARALEYAHGQGIIHRDIKPSNILITHSGEPMLADFGIAKILESGEAATLTGTGIGVGTPEYMAPEQWTGKGTAQSDIYSLGIVFYEMITGRKPYAADTPAAILLKQANEPLPRPSKFVPELPEVVERILSRSLAKNTEDRFSSMSELSGSLEKMLSAEPTAAAPREKSANKYKMEERIILQPAEMGEATVDQKSDEEYSLSDPRSKKLREVGLESSHPERNSSEDGNFREGIMAYVGKVRVNAVRQAAAASPKAALTAAVAAPTAAVAEERTYTGLRIFNAVMGCLHLVQGIFMWAISNDTTYPVFTNFLSFDVATQTLAPNHTQGFELRFGPAVAVFLLISAVAHFFLSTVGYNWYVAKLKSGINPARFYEYALSSSLMIVLIGMLVGVTDLGALILMFGLNAMMNLFGILMELHNQTTAKTDWTSFIYGCIAGIVPWIVIFVSFYGALGSSDAKPPMFVYFIVPTIFVFFNIFAINMFLQYKKVGPWKDYLFGERVYIVLSLLAKTALAWQIWVGTLRP